jgi:phosphoribosylformylglycinamidine synthase subunit PurS
MIYSVVVDVMPKSGISDPQGQAIERALPGLGFEGIDHVRVGRRIELTVEASDEAAAEEAVHTACDRILANPVIEEYRITLGGLVAAGKASDE